MNLEHVKYSNQSAVLRLLNNNGAMSRKDIAEAVGLTAASVTLICAELLEKNIIVELGEAAEEKRAGRKKILVDINKDYKSILCLAIETDVTVISVTDMKGNLIDSLKSKTDWTMTPEAFLKEVSDQAGRLLWDRGISKDMLLAVGVTVPGKVDTEKGVSESANNIWKRNIPIADIIKESLGVEVMVENNIKAAAELELLFGRGREEKNLFLLKWGPGVGSAMILESQIYNGSANAAGEIGHTTLGRDKKASLEECISIQAIRDDIRHSLGADSKYAEDLMLLGDDAVASIMDEKMDMLAQMLRNAVALIDPDRIIVLGYIFEVPGMIERFRSIYREYDVEKDECFIVGSQPGIKGDHLEPLAMPLNKFLNYIV
ncbi:MAG: ROK family transcriptional regulator [Lachnospiraceae bacterium]|nr:ROK family transcriptional regulator [Lachnospiraceae bacterium]